MDQMDLLPSVDALQDHLSAHDKAVRQIILLDQYIERLSEQSIHSTMDGHMSPSFRSMIRIAVAEGVKRMYKEYRLKKWLQVQEMANVVRQVLSFAVDDQPGVQGMTAHPSQQPMPAQLNWQPVPANLPLLSPIITPQRMPGTATTFNHTGVVAPAQHQAQDLEFNIVTGNGLYTSPRQLFPEEDCPTQELVECADDMSEDSAIDDSFHDGDIANQISDPSTSINQIGHQESAVMVTSHQLPSIYTSQTVPAGFGYQDNRHIPQAPQIEYFDSAEDSDEEDDMDWDEDMSSDENVAGVLFAAEHLLPEQQMVRLDVEMGDMGIGHVLFDRVSATWYTHHCEFHRAS